MSAVFPGSLRIAAFVIAVAFNPIAAAQTSGATPEAAGSALFDGGTGFRWGTSGGSFGMERTRDGGTTWSALDLSAVPIDLGALTISPLGKPSSIYAHFEDPDHGWLVWSADDTVLRIASTADGGDSWRIALSLGTDAIVQREIFPGPGRACLVAEMPEGMMHTTMVIVSTDDFGATWTSSSIDHGDGVGGWAFRSATDGFLSVDYPSGISILFFRTTDGGRSWQSVDLALPPELPEAGGTSPGTPVFSGPELLTGQLTVGIYLPDGTVDVIYRTADGGKTWAYSK